MIRHPLIFPSVTLKHFLFLALKRAKNIVLFVVPYKNTLDKKILLIMLNVHTVNVVEKALGQRKIMDCIKDICFPDPIVTNKAINFWREFQVGLAVVLEVCKAEFFKVHTSVPRFVILIPGKVRKKIGFENSSN